MHLKQCRELCCFTILYCLKNKKTVLFCLRYNLPLSKYQSMLWSQQLNSIQGQLLQNLEMYTKSWTNMKLNKNKTWAKFDAWWPTLTRWHKRVEAKQNYNSKSTVTITRTLIAKKTDRICKYVTCDDSCISKHAWSQDNRCSFMNKTRSFTEGIFLFWFNSLVDMIYCCYSRIFLPYGALTHKDSVLCECH